MEPLENIFNIIRSSPFLKSISILLFSIIIAKLVDIIFTFIFKRIVDQTQTSLDDQILQLLHKPVFLTILFFGFNFAIKVAKLPAEVEFSLIGIFKTITILIWLFVSIKILIITMHTMDMANKYQSGKMLKQQVDMQVMQPIIIQA